MQSSPTKPKNKGVAHPQLLYSNLCPQSKLKSKVKHKKSSKSKDKQHLLVKISLVKNEYHNIICDSIRNLMEIYYVLSIQHNILSASSQGSIVIFSGSQESKVTLFILTALTEDADWSTATINASPSCMCINAPFFVPRCKPSTFSIVA